VLAQSARPEPHHLFFAIYDFEVLALHCANDDQVDRI
jgi:hypothetical protein